MNGFEYEIEFFASKENIQKKANELFGDSVGDFIGEDDELNICKSQSFNEDDIYYWLGDQGTIEREAHYIITSNKKENNIYTVTIVEYIINDNAMEDTLWLEDIHYNNIREISNENTDDIEKFVKNNLDKFDKKILKIEYNEQSKQFHILSSQLESNNKNEKTVFLDGKKHEISIKDKLYSLQEESGLRRKDITILFDGKEVNTFYTYIIDDATPEMPEIYTIGSDLLFKIPTYSHTFTTYNFCFVNSEGNIIGIIPWSNETGISKVKDGTTLDYEINEWGMYFFGIEADYEGALKYQVRIDDTSLDVFPVKKFSKDEVRFAGAKR